MKTYSQVAQDLFALNKLNSKRNGTFVDIGSNDPITINNTYLLESEYDWEGISIEIDKKWESVHNSIRKSKLIVEDALKVNYRKVFADFLEKRQQKEKNFDYLSLDLEPAEVTLQCLMLLPLNEYRFSVITYEHDFYRFGDYYRKTSRDILTSHGYSLAVPDVLDRIDSNGVPFGNSFEDWWIDTRLFS